MSLFSTQAEERKKARARRVARAALRHYHLLNARQQFRDLKDDRIRRGVGNHRVNPGSFL